MRDGQVPTAATRPGYARMAAARDAATRDVAAIPLTTDTEGATMDNRHTEHHQVTLDGQPMHRRDARIRLEADEAVFNAAHNLLLHDPAGGRERIARMVEAAYAEVAALAEQERAARETQG